MLKRLSVRGFKSLLDSEIQFSKVTLLLGPMGAGKSSILRAITGLSNMATCPTVADALSRANDGDLRNAFSSVGDTGQDSLLSLEADIAIPKRDRLRYRIEGRLHPSEERVEVTDEYLTRLTLEMVPVKVARIEKVGDVLKIRRKAVHSAPYVEELGLYHTLLSDPRLDGPHYPDVDKCRIELSRWKAFKFSQLFTARTPGYARELPDVGRSGELLLPFLRRLELESPPDFESLQKAISEVLEGADALSVHLDERFGLLELRVRVHGVWFAAGALPEGVLRVIALLATLVNPWSGSVIAVDEPENGLDPRAAGVLGEVMLSLALRLHKQLIVSTHSPWLCEAIMAHQEAKPSDVSLLHVQNRGRGTMISAFEGMPLFRVKDLSEAMRA